MSRTAALRRIARLYSVVEEMHSVSLRQASAAVHETEAAIRTECDASNAACAASRTALSAGEREEWLFAQAECEISAVRAGLLEGMKAQRVETETAARTEFFESRIRTGQIDQVVTRMLERTAIEESRRSQATSDDRYAARRAWLSSRRIR